MSLREKTLTAVKWNLVSTVISSLLGIISLWILSHLLTTQDYGVISAASIIAFFFSMLLDFGISSSIIRSQKISKLELSTLYIINIFLGILFCLIAFAFSDRLAGLFNANGALSTQIRVISFSFIIISIGLQSKALLSREMNFDSIAKITILSAIIYFIIVVSMAWFFRSPWCVAIAFLASSIVSSASMVYKARHLTEFKLQFQLDSVKKHYHYGMQSVLDSLINQISVNTYPVLMSRLISLSAIGGYNIAYTISISLFEKLNPVLSHTLFPAFSRISDDESKLQSSFLRVTSYAALVNFPILLGMMIIAHSLVSVFFDSKWLFISPIVQVLCVVGAIRSLDTPVIAVLLVKAEMYRNIRLGIVKLILGIPLTWWLGNNMGLIGIVSGFLIIQLFNTVAGYFFLLKPSAKIQGYDYFKSIVTPLIHILPMIIIGFVLNHLLNDMNNLYQMIILILASIFIYTITIFLSPCELIKEFRTLILKQALRK